MNSFILVSGRRWGQLKCKIITSKIKKKVITFLINIIIKEKYIEINYSLLSYTLYSLYSFISFFSLFINFSWKVCQKIFVLTYVFYYYHVLTTYIVSTFVLPLFVFALFYFSHSPLTLLCVELSSLVCGMFTWFTLSLSVF